MGGPFGGETTKTLCLMVTALLLYFGLVAAAVLGVVYGALYIARSMGLLS